MMGPVRAGWPLLAKSGARAPGWVPETHTSDRHEVRKGVWTKAGPLSQLAWSVSCAAATQAQTGWGLCILIEHSQMIHALKVSLTLVTGSPPLSFLLLSSLATRELRKEDLTGHFEKTVIADQGKFPPPTKGRAGQGQGWAACNLQARSVTLNSSSCCVSF